MRPRHDRSQAMSARLQIVRRRFAGAPVGDDLVGDLLTFMKVMQAGPFDGADMDEHIGPAAVGVNEPEALRCIEPFHRARRHGASLSNRTTNLSKPPFIASPARI